MNKELKIEVSGNELQFIFQNAPPAFPTIIVEALRAEGIISDRVTVHRELRTIKKKYDAKIIETARRLLKSFKQLEFKENS